MAAASITDCVWMPPVVNSHMRTYIAAHRGFVAMLLLGVLACRTSGVTGDDRPRGFRVRVQTAGRWYKGDTHAHSNMSADGDSPPAVITGWYKDHGYSFVVLTDHNTLTDPGTIPGVADSSFIVIPGEEITMGASGTPVHVNGLGVWRYVPWTPQAGQFETIQYHVNAIRSVGGIAQINHPNFGGGLDTAVLATIRGAKLIEVYNAINVCYSTGTADRPSVEKIWDQMLGAGQEIYGVASDDAHLMQGTWSETRPNPGRAWIVVWAPRLASSEILKSIDAGNFYASTGVVLESIQVEAERITISIDTSAGGTYSTQFIGVGGEVLAETTDNPAVYDRLGTERYVRARITAPTGARAWVQPVFVDRQ